MDSEIESLKKENEILKSKLVYYDYLFNKFHFFKIRINFILLFLRFVGKDAALYGSVVRKLFDYSLRFDKSFLNASGNILSDINIIFNNARYHDKSKTVREFFNFIRYLENFIIFNLNKNEYTFNDFKLISVQLKTDIYDDNSKVIPRAVIHFENKIKEKIMIKLIAWRPKDDLDFSVNSCILNKDGITMNPQLYNSTFFDYLENIINSEASQMALLKVYQDNAFPLDGAVSREQKIIFMKKIYKFIYERSLRMIESGYNIVGAVPFLTIETKEDCHLTSCKAPYPLLRLECDHTISLMGYKGLYEKGDNENTESIRCPMCRSDLRIKFQTVSETTNRFKYYDFSKYIVTMGEFEKMYDQTLINSECLEHL